MSARLPRIAAQPFRYRVFRISPPGRNHLSGSGERPCRVRANRASATECGDARPAPPSTVVVRAVRCSTGGV